MKNNQKGFITTLLIVVVVLVLIGGGTYVYLTKGYANSVITSNTQTSNKTGAYRNKFLGYQISYQSPWIVSEDLSRKFDNQAFTLSLYEKAGCDPSSFADATSIDFAAANQKLQDCLKASPIYSDIESSYAKYLKNWNIENSQYVILTRLPLADQNNLSINISPAVIDSQWPQGSFILIRPFDSKLSFDAESTSSKSGLLRTFYMLPIGNIKGYSTDLRGTILQSKNLTIAIPKDLDQQIYMGGKMQSILFSTTATKNSQDEKDFYTIMQSVNLSQ
jgi:hypothetical protein